MRQEPVLIPFLFAPRRRLNLGTNFDSERSRWLKGDPVRHVAKAISELRRYIAGSEVRAELEETDSLLAVALEDLRRKIAQKYDDARAVKGS